MIRWAALSISLLALVGCKELYDGPRVVYYSDTNFYVRHLTWKYSVAEVATLAQQVCQRLDRAAELESEQQYYSFDIRYATYNCVGPEPAPPLHNPGPVPPPNA